MSFVETAKPAVRGGGTGRGRGRGGKVVMTKRKKDEMMAFADGIIQLLPIKFREQQVRPPSLAHLRPFLNRTDVLREAATKRNRDGRHCSPIPVRRSLKYVLPSPPPTLADATHEVPEFVKQTSLPTHRLNDALTALVRAKVALKVLAKVRFRGFVVRVRS